MSLVSPPERPVKVLLVDAREIASLGLRLVLSRETWVERCLPAASIEDALRMATRENPEVALVALSIGQADAIALGRRLVERGTRVLLLADGHPVPSSALDAAHAVSAVCEYWSARQLVSAVREAALGLTPPTPAPRRQLAALSQRERDVLQLVATGATNQEIGSYLFLSPHTVKQHTSGLYRKLGARNRTDAVQRARALGLLGGLAADGASAHQSSALASQN
jgi:DNA-binding NarL/FixJ family response regulator